MFEFKQLDVIVTRNGEKYVLIGNRFLDDQGWLNIDNYKLDLKNSTKDYDIMKIYRKESGVVSNLDRLLEYKETEKIWEREKEFSVAGVKCTVKDHSIKMDVSGVAILGLNLEQVEKMYKEMGGKVAE